MSESHHLATAIPVVRRVLPHEEQEGLSDEQLLARKLDDLVMDSLTRMELILKLEDTFSVLVNETELAKCKTVKDVIETVYRSEAAG